VTVSSSRWARRLRIPQTALQVVATQRFDQQARRWIRRYSPVAALGCLVGYLLGFTAGGWKGGLIGLAIVALVVLAGWGALIWRRATITIFAGILTAALVSSVVGKLYTAAGWSGEAPVTAASLWCLTIASSVAAWRVRRHRGNRAATALACDAVIVVAALVSTISPDGSLILAIVAVIAIITARGGLMLSLRVRRARRRSRLQPRELEDDNVLDTGRLTEVIGDDAALTSGLKREQQVVAELGQLDSRLWTTLHSRRIPETGDIVEQLLIGPAGIIVGTTAHWPESVTLTEVRNADGTWSSQRGEIHEIYTLEGSSELLAHRLEPVLVATRQVAWTLDVHPDELRCVIIFTTGAQQLPEPVVEIDLLGLWDPQRKCSFDATAYLVSVHALVGFLINLPHRTMTEAGRFAKLSERMRRADQRQAQQQRDNRFMRDVAAICDQLFKPV
jgi:hypothetical protein